jgi:hypothetical protein
LRVSARQPTPPTLRLDALWLDLGLRVRARIGYLSLLAGLSHIVTLPLSIGLLAEGSMLFGVGKVWVASPHI